MKDNALGSTMTRMKSLNLRDEQQMAEYRNLMKTLPDLIMGAEDSGEIGDCSIEDLQLALSLCRRISEVSERWEEILKTIKENIREKKHIGEWIRGLAPNRIPEKDVREIVDSLWIRQINQHVFPALEAEADTYPNDRLMNWYIAVLDRTERGEMQNRIFNRLAFHYMHSTQYGSRDREYTARAKAYLLAMERRGILPENPYGGYFGDYDHTGLIRSILDDTYEEKKISIRGKYAEGLMDRIREKGLAEDIDPGDDHTHIIETVFTDPDWDDLRNIVFTIYGKLRDNKRNEGEFSREDLELADRFLKRFCGTAEYFLKNCKGNETFRKAGAAMIRMLYDGDCWLFRHIELTAEGDARSLNREVDKWIELVKANGAYIRYLYNEDDDTFTRVLG